jgi:hypothetical protein
MSRARRIECFVEKIRKQYFGCATEEFQKYTGVWQDGGMLLHQVHGVQYNKNDVSEQGRTIVFSGFAGFCDMLRNEKPVY